MYQLHVYLPCDLFTVCWIGKIVPFIFVVWRSYINVGCQRSFTVGLFILMSKTRIAYACRIASVPFRSQLPRWRHAICISNNKYQNNHLIRANPHAKQPCNRLFFFTLERGIFNVNSMYESGKVDQLTFFQYTWRQHSRNTVYNVILKNGICQSRQDQDLVHIESKIKFASVHACICSCFQNSIFWLHACVRILNFRIPACVNKMCVKNVYSMWKTYISYRLQNYDDFIKSERVHHVNFDYRLAQSALTVM